MILGIKTIGNRTRLWRSYQITSTMKKDIQENHFSHIGCTIFSQR
ncbi:hypothetical protein HMPREF9151_01991 [Hoylesella saccharolytica F0055]|uniref:Uncharacterized protein n=1 Tax=Hoylesella saccharolytica F0055 TaxID=1127699 RepID=L1N4I8_9BACT|nr:hypothetical protein HMPREF9151_01991 [Hoylesella saccharolytica F0055]